MVAMATSQTLSDTTLTRSIPCSEENDKCLCSKLFHNTRANKTGVLTLGILTC